jgi:ribonuclease D
MPAYNKQTRFIDTQTQLDALCDGLGDRTIIGVDTEFVRTQTYFARLCLIQIATNSHVVCVDVLADLNTDPFLEILIGGAGLKIFHAAKQDLEAMYSTYGQLPEPIIDTQIAAGLLGHQSQIGYARLVEELLGIQLEKGQTRTDWSRRPLTAAQTEYAIDDVLYLAEMHSILQSGLEAVGRYAWALEDSQLLTDPSLYESHPEDAWQRISAVTYLPVAIQSRARQLAAWRENQARNFDRPRQWILADKALLAIAESNPKTQANLSQLPGISPGLVRNQGKRLLEVLQQANDDVEHQRIAFSRQSKPDTPDKSTLKQLTSIVQRTADELGISPDLLATRRDIMALIRGKKDIRLLRGWRNAIIGDRLLEAL